MTVFDHLRARLYSRAGLMDPPPQPCPGKTLAALRALAVAMAEDNACWHKKDAEFLGEEWLKWADERGVRKSTKGGGV